MTELLRNFTSFCKQTYAGLKQIKALSFSSLRKVFSLLEKTEKIAMGLLAAVAILALAVSFRNFYLSHSVLVPANGGVYTEGFIGQPTYINPLLAHQDPDLSLTTLVFSGLYKYDSQGKLIPDLADGMPVISADQKQYTIRLKRNVKWQNGRPLTADDVVFTIQALQNPSFKSPYSAMWQSTTVEKLDDYTVRFTTRDVSGPFLQNLTQPVLSKFIWSRVDPQNILLSNNNLKAIGSGPYAIKEIKKLASGKVDQITFTANNDYYLGRPKINTVIVKFYDTDNDVLHALQSGEIDGYGFTALGSNLYLDKDQSGLQLLALPLPQYQVAFFNLNNKILADDSVRQALNLAVDRTKIIGDVLKNQAILPTSPLLAGQAGAKPLAAAPNPAQAAALLDSAGWKVNPKTNLRAKKNQTLELRLVTNDSLADSDVAQALADQWQSLNLKIDLTIVPTDQITDSVIRPRNFDILLFPQKFNADPDPFAFWHSSQVKDPGFNLTGFADPNVDKLIDQARTTTDQQARAQLYSQFDQILQNKVPDILLDQYVYTYALPSDIKNITLNKLYDPSQRFYDIGNWYISEKRVLK